MLFHLPFPAHWESIAFVCMQCSKKQDAAGESGLFLR